MERYRVQYTRLPDLFQEIEEAKMNITYGQAHLIRKKSPVDTVTKSIESVV